MTRVFCRLLIVGLIVLCPVLNEFVYATDMDKDGDVDARDLHLFLHDWHITSSTAAAEVFEEGYINLDGILSETRSYAPEKLVIGRREFEDITHAMGKPKESTIWFEYDNSWIYEVKEFCDAIEGGKPLENGTSLDAHNALKLVEDLYECSGFYND